MDILVYAIKMELDGEKYYKEQAERNHGNSLYTVFMELAKEENNHARILEEKSTHRHYRFRAPVKSTLQNIFAQLSDFKSEINKIPQQAEAYETAMEKEKASIELYKKLLEETEDCPDLYQFLIAQEEEHHAILSDIYEMVNRPNQWVEAAEFGNRPEY